MNGEKPNNVTIIAIQKSAKYSYVMAGLGSDAKLYIYDYKHGIWIDAKDEYHPE